jgi:hypothetical protein
MRNPLIILQLRNAGFDWNDIKALLGTRNLSCIRAVCMNFFSCIHADHSAKKIEKVSLIVSNMTSAKQHSPSGKGEKGQGQRERKQELKRGERSGRGFRI